MKTIVEALIVATLAIGSGWARPDWIESTLVTVDLTGVWQGAFTRGGAYGPGTITLTLQQGGSKVTGQVLHTSSQLVGSRTVEGTINGDMFRFRTQDGRVTGELQVSGDEMKGASDTGGRRVEYSFRRQQ